MSRPASRVHRTRVGAVRQLTPHFTRITLAGEELLHFGSGGFDQRVKLLFPHADGTWSDVGLFDESDDVAGWYHRWRELPQERRNTMRTYTIRAARPHDGEVDVDFALHGTTGPASAWALSAAVGDEVAVVGPDARSDLPGGGVEWCPGDARRVLLVADESAAPAVASILGALPAHVTGHAFVEVPGPDDVLSVATTPAWRSTGCPAVRPAAVPPPSTPSPTWVRGSTTRGSRGRRAWSRRCGGTSCATSAWTARA